MSIQINSNAVVCNVAVIKGDVKIGTKTIIHPCAKILATGGPIVIGDSNIIEELACIENRSKNNETLYIGNWNVFEVRSSVYASVIGDNNVFETNCVVGEEVAIGNGCIFGVGTKVNNVKPCPDHSVFYGNPLRHRIANETPPQQTSQIDFLCKVLPNYHHIKKIKDTTTTKDTTTHP